MIEELELYYGVEMNKLASQEIVNFTRIILAWKKSKLDMSPDDVLNYMIQEKLISENEALCLLVESFLLNNSVDIVLPKKYNL